MSALFGGSASPISTGTRVFYSMCKRALLGLVLTLCVLIVSGCLGCGSNDTNGFSLLASGEGSNNQSQSGQNLFCAAQNDLKGSSIPRTEQTFAITLEGAVDAESFAPLSGLLIVSPTRATAGDIDLNNDSNARDVGLFSDADPLITPAVGALSFATNTAILVARQRGEVPPPALAAVDVALVDANEDTNTLTVTIDKRLPNSNARLNVMSAKSGAPESVLKLESGTLTLEFAGSGGQTVTGNISFFGRGLDQAPTELYQASLSGTRRPQ
jgi:hypothetical protein